MIGQRFGSSVKPLVLFVLAILLCIGSGWALAAPMREAVCDARMVAENMKALTETEFVEVVNTLEAIGAIDTAWAIELRAFISEAYAAPDPGIWVRTKCAPQSKT